MSTQDRDSKLLDYLYEEMDAPARRKFEQELESDAKLREEVTGLQHVRSMLANIEEEPAPSALMNDIMRQARLAVDDTQDEGLMDRMLRWLSTPAFATGALALSLIAIGGYLSTSPLSPEKPPQPNGYNVAMLDRDAVDESVSGSDMGSPSPTSTAPAEVEKTPAVAAATTTPEGVEFAEAELATTRAKPAGSDSIRAASNEDQKRTSERAQLAAAAPTAPPASPTVLKTAAKPTSVAQRTRKAKAKNKPTAPTSSVGNAASGLAVADAAKRKRSSRAKDSVASKELLESGIASAYGTAGAHLDGTLDSDTERKPASVVWGNKGSKGNLKSEATSSLAQRRQRVSQVRGRQANIEPRPSTDASTIPVQSDTQQNETGAAPIDSYRKRGMQHFNKQRFGLALRDLQRYVDAKDGANVSPAVHKNLAQSYGRTNQTRNAIRAYGRLLSNYPNYKNRAAVLLEIALLQAKVGNLEEARKLLQEASKDASVARKARLRLRAINEKLATKPKAKKSKAAKQAPSKKATNAAPKKRK